ncbi:caspase family protein [Actinoplanes sp. N902-109]|uniref:caspase, EACC1-associated type n=1 Tax=Actinoplanes sp. (strain N902-109) TaxID=649831 RepID=UPI00032934E5|nr:caspase family protein [Actinoplanes sp. N902-109]AGL18921.1 peptidase C14 caspase catalytic subunit p20 [Actinoplanes sp. N902-109]
MSAELRYRALLLGNWQFPGARDELPDLMGPATDLTAMRIALTDHRCGLFRPDDVRVVENAVVQQMRLEVNTFLSAAARDEQVLVYYSGHGWQTALGELHLCAYDTDLQAVRATTVSAGEINAMLQECRAKAKVVLLDCCYSGNFRHKGAAGTASFTPGQGQAVLTSSQVGVLSLDAAGAGEPSPFTRHLADALRGAARDSLGTGYLTSEDVYRYVHDQMAEAGPHRPARSHELVGDVALARAGRPATGGVLDPDISARRLAAALGRPARHRSEVLAELRVLSERAHGDWRLLAALRLGAMASAEGDRSTAIEAYGAVAGAAHPRWSSEAGYELGTQLRAAGQPERAAAAWQAVVDGADPVWSVRAAHQLGRLLTADPATTPTGLRHLRRAVAEPAAAWHLAEMLRAGPGTDEARALYRRLRAAAAQPWSDRAAARLAELDHAGGAPPSPAPIADRPVPLDHAGGALSSAPVADRFAPTDRADRAAPSSVM